MSVPFHFTGSPRSAANQLLAHMGFGKELAMEADAFQSLQEENERLRNIIDILKRQIDILLNINVESARRDGATAPQGPVHPGNMGTILEDAPPGCHSPP